MNFNIMPYIPPICATKEDFIKEMERREKSFDREIKTKKIFIAILCLLFVALLAFGVELKQI